MAENNGRVIADVEKLYNRQLYESLCVASSAHTYSICMEYMTKWFKSKFNDDFFKSVYIDSKHVLDDYRSLNKTEQLKRLKPSLAILCNMDVDFNNDRLDAYPWGPHLYTARGKFRNAFFNDIPNDIHLGIGMDTTLFNFIFKVRLTTRAQQLDVLKYMKLAFRVGFTQGEDISMDFHVPYSLMLQMAKDMGFYIKEDKISNVTKFLSYLNAHSTLPFLYKYRAINGHSEFFIRLDHMYVHMSTPNVSADDGEREGKLSTNYIIELPVTVRFPSPNFYAYYSGSEHKELKPSDTYDSFQSLDISMNRYCIIPEINEYKWPQYITTEYSEDNLQTPLTIDFTELFEGDLKRVIDWTLDANLSPDKFMEIKVFNAGYEITNDTMNWRTGVWSCEDNPKSAISMIAIYCDLEHINNTIQFLDKYYEDRAKKDDYIQ